DAVSHAVVSLADEVSAKLIIAFSESGFTARRIARYRPKQPILASSPSEATLRKMNFTWGTLPIHEPASKNFDEALLRARQLAARNSAVILKKGDTFVISAGVPFGRSGTTNLALVQQI